MRNIFIILQKEDCKNDFIGKAFATNWDEKLISANWDDFFVLKDNVPIKIGEVTVFDPFSFLDSVPNYKIKVMLEKINDDYEKLWVNCISI